MSDLAKLARKPKKQNIRGIEIEMMPLGPSDMDLFDKLGAEGISNEERILILREIIKKCIIGSTDEEVDNMSMEYIVDFQEALAKIHNMDDEKIKEKLKLIAEIKAKQQGK